MKIQKLRDVKTPNRGTSLSAGIDFFVPNDFEPVEIKRNHSILIPSGIRVEVPKGHALIAFNKSGVATKQNLQVGACVVDEDYEGEVHLHMVNVGDHPILIQPGQKIVQFILIPVNYSQIEEVYAIDRRNTERGSGGFGSTGI